MNETFEPGGIAVSPLIRSMVLRSTGLGRMHAASFAEDPKHLGFVLARYKFVAKMLRGYARVLEVGCGDGTGARIVRPEVDYWCGVDKSDYGQNVVHDMVAAACAYKHWDAIYCLDVLEHIRPDDEFAFLDNISLSLSDGGVFICGTPSLESQQYASPNSKREHVNCKTEQQLRDTLGLHFEHVFMFGMNDETLHTGFGGMCHYRLALCVA